MEDRGHRRLSDRQENSVSGSCDKSSGPLFTVKETGFKVLIECILWLQKSNSSFFVVGTEMTY